MPYTPTHIATSMAVRWPVIHMCVPATHHWIFYLFITIPLFNERGNIFYTRTWWLRMRVLIAMVQSRKIPLQHELAITNSAYSELKTWSLQCRNSRFSLYHHTAPYFFQFIIGIGASAIQPFGISYIDDNSEKKDSALYVGRYSTVCLSVCQINGKA